jgi:hypothetical protein
MIGSGSAVADCNKESLIIEAEGCWFIQAMMPFALSIWRGRTRTEMAETVSGLEDKRRGIV